MILAMKKTTPQADLGNSPFSLRLHRLESLCYQLTAKWYYSGKEAPKPRWDKNSYGCGIISA